MRHVLVREPYSYRTDPAVPKFDDAGPLVVVDGECALCTRAARVIARLDTARQFRIGRTQSALGKGLLGHYGLNADDPESWLYLDEGRAYTSLEGVIEAGTRLGGAGRLLQLLRLLPRSVQDWLYLRVARNRYRLFGRTDICAVPDPGLRARLIE